MKRLNKEFEVEFYELFSKNANKNEKEIELKLNKEKQKLIRLVAVKNDKNFFVLSLVLYQAMKFSTLVKIRLMGQFPIPLYKIENQTNSSDDV